MDYRGGKSLYGAILTKRDRLRDFITLCREGYILAADPPAVDYARNVEVTERDDLTRRSRPYLLRLGIDVKYIVADLLVKLPRRRAEVLHSWILNDTDYAWSNLTYSQRMYLKRDRGTLAVRLHAGLGE